MSTKNRQTSLFYSSSRTFDPLFGLESPPSLIFSDFSEELESSAAMAPNKNNNGHRVDASVLMQDLLGLLDSVAEHLRQKDANDAANDIAKSAIHIVDTFHHATATWDLDSFLISPQVMTNPEPALANASFPTKPRSAPGSWASVAATEAKGNNHIIKYRPSDGVVRRVYDEPEGVQEDLLHQDMRVIWIQGWSTNRPLAQITECMSQGAIQSMVYSPEHGAVCIIFQYAESVQQVLSEDAFHKSRVGYGLFGPQCSVLEGEAYPENEDIRRMAPPNHERRRLTFVRSQLFTHGMTEVQFKHDINNLVGEANVELVWLFNTGNATVVFTSTLMARLVREHFRKKSRSKGPYENISVSFSHDPCEKSLNLITQMDQGRTRSGSLQSGVPGAPLGPGLGRSNSRASAGSHDREGKRMQKKTGGPDKDGWQKVMGKRR